MNANCNMEFHSDYGEESKDLKKSRANTCLSPKAKQKKKLGSILNVEKCERTYDDFHPQVLKNAEKSKGFHQKQQVERKSGNSEELVRYMSCLPTYLERGENPQEKPFNIGVLDWRLLQKWQNSNNDVVGIIGKHSPSTSKATSFLSPEGSSSYCSSDHTWSHHQQKMKYPSPPTEDCSSGTKLPDGNGGESLHCKNGSINLSKLHQSSLEATQSFSLDSANRLIYSKSEDRRLLKVIETRSQPLETDGVVSGLKWNGMIQKEEASKVQEQVPSSAVADRDFSERCKTAVPESRNDPGSRHLGVGHQSDSPNGNNNRLLEENRYTFHGGSRAKVCYTKSRSDHTRFYSIASGSKTKDSQTEESFAKEIRSLNCPSGKEQTMQFTESVSISPSRRKNLENKNLGSKPRDLTENETFQMKAGISESTKVRNPSPTRRFSFGMGRIGKSSNSNASATANEVSENIPDSKVTSTAACSKYSTTDKSNASSRARTSPLRRLLDPILKPKGADSHDVARSYERNPSTTDRTSKSSKGQREAAALRSVKGTLDPNGSSTEDIGGPRHIQKNGTSSVQALLQVAVKNGLPLFTFTVNKCSDVLAATVKELSSNKSTRAWIYTFFSFSEMKKKNAYWINQGSKDRNHGYVSNIVAQMKVSDVLSTYSTAKRCASNSCRREFVLSSVGARDVDQTSDLLPGDELAAVVVKFPERIGEELNQGDYEGNECASDDPFSMTVILPGGHHGVPSKGEPSPLIERWKSGGSCDCGGWDLGCQLRILANSNQSNQSFKSKKSQLNAFELFSQEEVEQERPMFILSPFQDGIFSVEFNSSLKLVQAFSIAIAFLHSRRSAVLSSNMLGGKMSEEITASENSASKIFNRAQVKVSAKYATIPPLSPVGRV